MRCVVLGGTGFLGGHVIEALRDEGHDVRALAHTRASSTDRWPADVAWHVGDFEDAATLDALFDGCDVVVHLVGTTLPGSSNDDPIHDLASNLLPTIRLLNVARARGVKKIVFASSGGTVYGVARTPLIREDHPTEPICSYGIQKLAIEHYLRLYHRLHGLDYCVLRLANPFGERQPADRAQGAIAVFLDAALRGQPIAIWGDGSTVRDYVYIGDVSRAFCRAVACGGDVKTFNIGSGRGQSLLQLLDAIEILLGCPVMASHRSGRACDVPSNVLDVSLAARHLRWRPEVTFLDGLRRTVSWMQAQRQTADLPVSVKAGARR